MQYLFLISQLVLLWLSARSVFQGIYEILVVIGFSRKLSIKMLAFIFLPGTLIHELSHMFMAESLRVRTGKFTIFPVEEGESIKLGSVRVERTDPIRSFLIGVAPLIVGILVILALTVLVFEVFRANLGIWYIATTVVLGSYTIFVVANTMFSSRKDIEACLEFIGIFVVLSILLYFIWDEHILKIISFFMSDAIIDTLKVVNKILLIPLVINILIILPKVLFRSSHRP